MKNIGIAEIIAVNVETVNMDRVSEKMVDIGNDGPIDGHIDVKGV